MPTTEAQRMLFWQQAFLTENGRLNRNNPTAVADEALEQMNQRFRPDNRHDSYGGVTVGDTVQVRRVVLAEPGWQGAWTPDMNDTVGNVAVVLAIFFPGDGVQLNNGHSYPIQAIEINEPEA